MSDQADAIILSIREHRKIRPLPARSKAWERASAALSDSAGWEDVKLAWSRVKIARLGPDPEIFELRMDDFKLKLAAWLNS